MKNGDVAGQEGMEEKLKERETVEKWNEIRRTGLAAIAGVLVGSGAAFRAADEYLGLRTARDYWGNKLGHLFGGHTTEVPIDHHKVITGTAHIAETVAPVEIKPTALYIGTRGPEGAIIDEFRNNPEIAKKFGWLGGSKEELSKWAGSKAHILWGESAKQALLDPSVKQELAKFGYPETAEGYGKAMTRIGKGFVFLNTENGSAKLADVEYLKNIKEVFPSSDIHERLVGHSGITVNYEVGGVPQTPLHTELVNNLTQPATASLKAEDFAEIQKQMDLPEGKLRGLLINSGVREEDFAGLFKREGGIERLLRMPVRDLHGLEEGYPRPVQLDRLYEGLQKITGDARLNSNDTLEDVLKSVESRSIFHGTAREILGEGVHNSLQTASVHPTEHIIGNPAPSPVELKRVSEAIVTVDKNQDVSAIAHNEVVTPPHPPLINEIVVGGVKVKGIFSYDSNGNVLGMHRENLPKIQKYDSLFKDGYDSLIKQKFSSSGKGAGDALNAVRGAKAMEYRLFQDNQILKTLKESGKGSSEEAKFLEKIIKNTLDQIESKYGKIFK